MKRRGVKRSGVKPPGVKRTEVGEVNHPAGESSVRVKIFFFKGVNRSGVNAKMGETSANLSNCWGGETQL